MCCALLIFRINVFVAPLETAGIAYGNEANIVNKDSPIAQITNTMTAALINRCTFSPLF